MASLQDLIAQKEALEREIEMAPFAGMLTTAEIVERSREDKVTH